MKFKVGDKVRVREDLLVNKRYGRCYFVKDMEKYKGKILTIEEIYDGFYKLDKSSYVWDDRMLESYKELNKEHYEKEIVEIAISDDLAIDKHTRRPTACSKLKCEDCVAGGYGDCSTKIKEWGDGEYVEPKPPVKLTRFEYEYLKRLKDDGYKYLARDEDNSIHAFTIEPYYDCHDWFVVDNDYYYVFEDLFIFVRRQDEKPCSIDYILENCEVIENVD